MPCHFAQELIRDGLKVLANACRGEAPCTESGTCFMALNRIVLRRPLENALGMER